MRSAHSFFFVIFGKHGGCTFLYTPEGPTKRQRNHKTCHPKPVRWVSASEKSSIFSTFSRYFAFIALHKQAHTKSLKREEKKK